MHRLILSPFITFVENHLFPGTVQRAICHLVTGQVLVLTPGLQILTGQLATRDQLVLNDDLFQREKEGELGILLQHNFVISIESDPFDPFFDYYLVRPRQNPAVSFLSSTGETVVVRTSMRERHYSPAVDQSPKVFKEVLPMPAAKILSLADGTKTLARVFRVTNMREDELRDALVFLTDAERQLVKLAPDDQYLDEPFQPFNSVPRTFHVFDRQAAGDSEERLSVADFHAEGIGDASWEFDWIEPTVNHAFRFPSPAFGGLSYGARFCDATLDLFATNDGSLKVLEVGGGTGSFARSFLDHARIKLEYHLLDLAPTLFERQRQVLAAYLSPEHHYLQNATELTLPEQNFDLIVANEVIADFPVAVAERVKTEAGWSWAGDGGLYVAEFGLEEPNMPECFLVNSGVFEFMRRAWNHLSPGGVLVMTEYGGVNRYPVRAYHLNHDEFSIHFGHVEKCARALGFDGRILSLKEFLSIDDGVEFLDGQEERILCLNQVLRRLGESLPYAAISRMEFGNRLQPLAEEIQLGGVTFSPLRAAFHYGPTLEQFFVAVLQKPSAA